MNGGLKTIMNRGKDGKFCTLGEEMLGKKVTVRLSETTYAEFTAYCAWKGLTMASIIRNHIQQVLENAHNEGFYV